MQVKVLSTDVIMGLFPFFDATAKWKPNVVVEWLTPASNTGGPGFQSQPGDLLSRMWFFVVFLSP
jgi:hypothetical protein